MLTIQTCPTSYLEALCKRYANPTTLEESAILKGAKCEMADRNDATIAIRKTRGLCVAASWEDTHKTLDRESALLRS